MAMAGELPKAAREPPAAIPDDTSTGANDCDPKVPMTFSSEKNTPAMGALKAAEMPDAAPHATSTLSRLGPDRKNRPMRAPPAARGARRGLDRHGAAPDPPAPLGHRAHDVGYVLAVRVGRPVPHRRPRQGHPGGHHHQDRAAAPAGEAGRRGG